MMGSAGTQNERSLLMQQQWEEDYGTQNYRPLNRGQKLKPRTLEPQGAGSIVNTLKPSLWAMYAIDETTKFEKIGKKRVISKKAGGTSNNNDIDDGIEDGPYAKINIEELWAPLEHATDIKRNKALTHTLRNRQLKIMGQNMLDRLEEEVPTQQLWIRMSDFLQQDNPMAEKVNWDELGVPNDVVSDLRHAVQECLGTSQEYYKYLSKTRSKVLGAYQTKKRLAKKLVPFPKSTSYEQ